MPSLGRKRAVEGAPEASPNAGYRYLFGPVMSRRLGRSLGVDLVPLKTCTFNCVFCQLGRTPSVIAERAEYVPTEAVMDEFRRWLAAGGQADVATLAGSGEPTLHTGFGEVLREIRRLSGLPTALLTNSSLMHLPEVRAAAAEANIVKASLSAWDDASLRAINRPAPGFTLRRIVDGLREFRAGFRGQIWIEVFVLPGLNDTPEATDRLAALVASIRPDRVQLNTVVRPPAERVGPASPDALREMARRFDPPAEIIANVETSGSGVSAGPEAIAGLVARHPCTLDEIAAATGMPPEAVRDCVRALMRDGRVVEERLGEKVYIRAPVGG
jgi:wyosine [tRNA(Phe)-imidazoG37] synthetase (radical SAM superfamily)